MESFQHGALWAWYSALTRHARSSPISSTSVTWTVFCHRCICGTFCTELSRSACLISGSAGPGEPALVQSAKACARLEPSIVSASSRGRSQDCRCAELPSLARCLDSKPRDFRDWCFFSMISVVSSRPNFSAPSQTCSLW